MNFTYFAPTKVCFGTIDTEALQAEIMNYGTNVLLLTGGASTSAIARKIADRLGTEISFQLFSGVATNPLSTHIEEIVAKASKPNVIISVGGGSVHDSAKALSIVLTHEGTVEQYTTDGEYSVPGIKNRLIPVITIPTLSGSGAEVSPAALIRVRDKKRVIFSPYLYPKTTFIDPSLAMSLSRELFMNSALDALVQGIESYVSTASQDFSKRFSKSTITRVIKTLLALRSTGITKEIVEQLALASIEGLYAVGQSSVGAVHAISDPLSGIFDVHHGHAVGMLLPYVAETNYESAASAYDDIQKIFDEATGRRNSSIQKSILRFYSKIGFDPTTTREKLLASGFADCFQQCIRDSYNADMVGNPRELDDALIGKILKKTVG